MYNTSAGQTDLLKLKWEFCFRKDVFEVVVVFESVALNISKTRIIDKARYSKTKY